ncbi:MAG: hypothetical protein AVDCRST_MAG49-1443 [uncultured Thermomicrobiales bacterium]|uniref:Uncharacterized protein n=1 Tax=uncultured Thermomicrobiales bacterium TaxID=1645740 RepID=A0A6J4UD09_9BACT|nr:MAG: hypothetical protein AVDCRST_MAG49-1443 [uncultured Thermomicrobiales bacterium]
MVVSDAPGPPVRHGEHAEVRGSRIDQAEGSIPPASRPPEDDPNPM